MKIKLFEIKNLASVKQEIQHIGLIKPHRTQYTKIKNLENISEKLKDMEDTVKGEGSTHLI